ncbi:MAG: DUF2752 domain-containing protein [Acidimicrobiales bacterium]
MSQFGLLGAPHEATASTRGRVTRAARRGKLAAAAGLAAVTSYVYLVDPDKGGAYPLCPSRTLLGIDCPACGGLRGTNALLHGQVSEALDHNVLLPVYLAFIAAALGFWLLPLIGRQPRSVRPPRWLLVGIVGVLAAFTVARNLPVAGFDFLASEA